jgi:hypothetical protein
MFDSASPWRSDIRRERQNPRIREDPNGSFLNWKDEHQCPGTASLVASDEGHWSENVGRCDQAIDGDMATKRTAD